MPMVCIDINSVTIFDKHEMVNTPPSEKGFNLEIKYYL